MTIEPVQSGKTLARLVRFAIVGALATGTHAVVLYILVEFAGLRPSIATVGGFLVAFFVSYFGHYYFTFGSDQSHTQSLPKYVLAATTGAAVNYALFVVVADWLALNYWIAFGLTIIVVPVVVYVLSHLLVFKPASDTGSPAND